MAGNIGKFIDRSPIICAAGKLSESNQSVADCLKYYLLQNEVDALKHDAGVFEEHPTPFEYELPRLGNSRTQGIYTEIKPILQPPVKTRYQTLINDLKETSYDSYWNKEDGKTRDPTPGLPPGLEPLGTTFGDPSVTDVSVKDLVNPPKTVYEVLWDSQVGHEMYKKTHNDYNPGEHVERGYSKPPYNPNKKYGERTLYDPRGIWVRCACHWHNNEPTLVVDEIQANVLERTRPQLGKSLTRNKNIECVPKGHTFGKPSKREFYGVPELLKDQEVPPCVFKRDFLQWLRYLQELRLHLKKINMRTTFDLRDFYAYVLYYDKEKIGWLPKKFFYEICACHGVNYEHKCLEPLLRLTGVLNKDGEIFYKSFIKLIDINQELPFLAEINDMPPAGVPCVRYDLPRPVVPFGGCRADLENLGDETTAGALINPSIYSNFGLTHRDFFQPRLPATMKKLFETLGYTFPNDSFERLWKIGVENDKTGLVCIDTFKKLMKQALGVPKFVETKREEKC